MSTTDYQLNREEFGNNFGRGRSDRYIRHSLACLAQAMDLKMQSLVDVYCLRNDTCPKRLSDMNTEEIIFVREYWEVYVNTRGLERVHKHFMLDTVRLKTSDSYRVCDNCRNCVHSTRKRMPCNHYYCEIKCCEIGMYHICDDYQVPE